jgi:hypothetical protein
MKPASVPLMRIVSVLAATALAACAGGEIEIHGTVAEGAAVSHVWAVGGGAGEPVDAGRFTIRAPRGEVVDLRFDTGGGETMRLVLRDLPRRGAVHLDRVWLDERSGTAFPGGIRLDRGRAVEVNGVRMGDARRLPSSVDLDAVVLARSGDAEALLVRPMARRLPDLPLVITPGTLVTSPDGDPLSLEPVEPGDTLHVRAERTGDFLVALQIVVPRRAAARGLTVPRGNGRLSLRGSRRSGGPPRRAR